ncbi:MAG TPA: hypothetical protein VD758_02325 [Gemmatimonadaceae bacterium]|nr:hypothetical protein [Gemmatimonadaceae bacterium]
MNESTMMVILRLIHIIGGVFWVGTVLMIAWFLMPATKATGQSGLAVMQDVMMRQKLSVYLMTAMGLTILSGLAMYVHLSMATNGAWSSSTMGKVLGFGALCGIVGGAIGGSNSRSTGLKMAAIGKAIQESGKPPTEEQRAEIDRLQTSAQKVLRIVAVLLLLAVASMASARYL